MIELPMHPVLDEEVIYIVGMTGSGKTTIAREILRMFDGPKAVVSDCPSEYSSIENIEFFDDWGAALRSFEEKPKMLKKLLIIDENKPIDISKFRPTNTTIVILSQKYEPFMRGHTVIFLRIDAEQLDEIPIRERSKKLLEHARPGFGILYNGDEVPVYFYV